MQVSKLVSPQQRLHAHEVVVVTKVAGVGLRRTAMIVVLADSSDREHSRVEHESGRTAERKTRSRNSRSMAHGADRETSLQALREPARFEAAA